MVKRSLRLSGRKQNDSRTKREEMIMNLHYETSVRDGGKAAKPKARPTGAVFTYRPLKVKTDLKAG